MQVETQISNGKTITFIVADDLDEAGSLMQIAPENTPMLAILEPQGKYLFPYLKIVYEGVMQ